MSRTKRPDQGSDEPNPTFWPSRTSSEWTPASLDSASNNYESAPPFSNPVARDAGADSKPETHPAARAVTQPPTRSVSETESTMASWEESMYGQRVRVILYSRRIVVGVLVDTTARGLGLEMIESATQYGRPDTEIPQGVQSPSEFRVAAYIPWSSIELISIEPENEDKQRQFRH